MVFLFKKHIRVRIFFFFISNFVLNTLLANSHLEIKNQAIVDYFGENLLRERIKLARPYRSHNSPASDIRYLEDRLRSSSRDLSLIRNKHERLSPHLITKRNEAFLEAHRERLSNDLSNLKKKIRKAEDNSWEAEALQLIYSEKEKNLKTIGQIKKKFQVM